MGSSRSCSNNLHDSQIAADAQSKYTLVVQNSDACVNYTHWRRTYVNRVFDTLVIQYVVRGVRRWR